MSNITSIRSGTTDFSPVQVGKLNQLFTMSQHLFEKWGYLPIIPLLKQSHLNTQGEESLQQNILETLCASLSQMTLPSRFWYMGPVNGSYEMGIECIGADALTLDAEVISVAIEILRLFHIREFRLLVGNKRYMQSLIESGDTDAERKISLLRGDEHFLDQVKAMSSERTSIRALEDLKWVGHVIREFGFKDHVHFDLRPFLSEVEYQDIIFKIECGSKTRLTISGGRRKRGSIEAVGFSLNVLDLLSAANEIGVPVPSPKIDFLLVNRKKTRKSSFEVMKVLRGHGYSVALDHSDMNREELLDYAQKSGVLNLLIIGDEELQLHEVRLIDVTDRISTKLSVADIFDEKSGINKLLRYHKRLELES